MKWPNMWKLKDEWRIEEYTDATVTLYHVKSGLSQTVKLPPLVQKLMEYSKQRGEEGVRTAIKQCLGM